MKPSTTLVTASITYFNALPIPSNRPLIKKSPTSNKKSTNCFNFSPKTFNLSNADNAFDISSEYFKTNVKPNINAPRDQIYQTI